MNGAQNQFIVSSFAYLSKRDTQFLSRVYSIDSTIHDIIMYNNIDHETDLFVLPGFQDLQSCAITLQYSNFPVLTFRTWHITKYHPVFLSRTTVFFLCIPCLESQHQLEVCNWSIKIPLTKFCLEVGFQQNRTINVKYL